MNVLGVLLAAGGGTRFVGPDHKLLTELDGRPLWAHALDHLLDARFEHAVMITGAARIDVLAVGEVAADRPLTVIHNDDWATGQASSLRVAVRAAVDCSADAIVVGLADQPFVASHAWRAVADAHASCDFVVASYDGRIGPNPVRIAARWWPHLPSVGDEGARSLLAEHRDRVCSVECLGSADDIDTLEDLARWTS